jgi:hypothetical protein
MYSRDSRSDPTRSLRNPLTTWRISRAPLSRYASETAHYTPETPQFTSEGLELHPSRLFAQFSPSNQISVSSTWRPDSVKLDTHTHHDQTPSEQHRERGGNVYITVSGVREEVGIVNFYLNPADQRLAPRHRRHRHVITSPSRKKRCSSDLDMVTPVISHRANSPRCSSILMTMLRNVSFRAHANQIVVSN